MFGENVPKLSLAVILPKETYVKPLAAADEVVIFEKSSNELPIWNYAEVSVDPSAMINSEDFQVYMATLLSTFITSRCRRCCRTIQKALAAAIHSHQWSYCTSLLLHKATIC
jgi:hypothetical protein